MAKNKTTETESSVVDFINSVGDEAKRKDAFELLEIMKNVTGFEPKMWGPGIIGFGNYHYKYESGHEGNAPLAGFSPRKDAISLYLNSSFENKEELLSKFGKHKAGKGCIYIKKLTDINLEILKTMISTSVKEIQKLYPPI
ncbi:DUF1801 domain-containing protein [Flavobacterium fluviatile]|uniref:DUF1801 domain-containing protein n=1 Tax=Flavobacterium fluviatile TaxID=1862387 RepID=UPI0013D3A059|nr:DUF1801 domain-containing protein [Flavobacterium fluviatile]